MISLYNAITGKKQYDRDDYNINRAAKDIADKTKKSAENSKKQ